MDDLFGVLGGVVGRLFFWNNEPLFFYTILSSKLKLKMFEFYGVKRLLMKIVLNSQEGTGTWIFPLVVHASVA